MHNFQILIATIFSEGEDNFGDAKYKQINKQKRKKEHSLLMTVE